MFKESNSNEKWIKGRRERDIRIRQRLQKIIGYEEATEQVSSSSGCFFPSGWNGFLGTKGDIGCKDAYANQKLLKFQHG